MARDAEIDALRRRAYGPRADIADDPAAMARLAELERQLTAEVVAPESSELGDGARASTDASAAAATEAPVAGAPPSQGGTGAPQTPRHASRPAWHTAMVAAVAAVTLLIGGAAAARNDASPTDEALPAAASLPDPGPVVAFSFASDPSSKILLRVPLDGSHGHLLDLPAPGSGPDFPTEQALRWTQPLGDYYGWRLWIARDQDDNLCMLITAADTFARCSTPDELAEGALFLSVSYDMVTDFERPAAMRRDQSIGFWLVPGDTVLILTGLTADAASP